MCKCTCSPIKLEADKLRLTKDAQPWIYLTREIVKEELEKVKEAAKS